MQPISKISIKERLTAAEPAKAKLALDVLAQQARHWIGAFYLELNGADALVFTAGIGENRVGLRSAICANLDQLGIVLDSEKNKAPAAQEAAISKDNSPVKVMVIPTNEELVVAREVKRFLDKESAVAAKNPTERNEENQEEAHVLKR